MKVEDFLKYVLPEVPGAPDEIASRAVVLATDEFLRNTLAWEIISDPIDLVAGERDYDMEVVPGALALTIRSVWTRNGELKPVTMSELQDRLPDWQVAQGTEPRFYNMVKGFGTLSVYPTPIEPFTSQLTFHSVYTIKKTSTTIPDDIVEQYLDAIASGAKARLMIMPGVSWSNPQLAVAHKQLFDDAVVKARIDAHLSRVPGSPRVRPIRFGR